MDGDAGIARTPEEIEEDRDFYRWYGAWEPYTPTQVASLLADLPAPWWIVGGWAVDAFTGVPREHEDVDVAFFRADLPAILGHLSPGLCIWSNLSGTLRPLRKPEDLIEGSRQLWVRRDGQSPWVMDLAMTPTTARPGSHLGTIGSAGRSRTRPSLPPMGSATCARSSSCS